MPDTAKPVVMLDVRDHRRDILGFRYVYPVVSRRSGGVSVGINLNPNNACNWRCVYCQVPDLVRGAAPEIDLSLLEYELGTMLAELVEGDFMQSSVPAGLRQLNDIALSGNGEPTASPQFGEAIEIVGRQSSRFGLANSIKTVLITNGSQLTKPAVLTTLDALSALNGEIWLKVDRAPVDGFSWVNQVSLKADQLTRHLVSASSRCRTWVQTCMFALDGFPPDEAEVRSYLQLLANAKQEGADLAGVLLYGIARPSTQPEASRLTNAPEAWMRALADRIEALGLPVKLTL